MSKKKLTEEQKVMLILEGMKGETNVVDLCRKYGITTGYYYQLRDKALEGMKSGIKGEKGDKKVKDLKNKLKEYKEIIGDLTIQNEILKKTVK